MRRPRGTTAVALLLALLVVACEPAAPADVPVTTSPPLRQQPTEPEEPISGGTLRFAVREPATVPFDAGDPDSLVVVDALFDSLTAWTGNLALRASAATGWETPDDGRTWLFHLREDASFHDGSTPVTAADFAFAWDLAAAGGQAGLHLRRVEGYEAVVEGDATSLSGVSTPGRHTLQVRLSEPYGAFPWVVAHPALGPVPRRLWERDATGFRRQPVGNGPFMAAEALVHGQFLRVQRFDGWRNGPEPALLDEVLFQFMDADTAFVAFQQGRLQVSPLPTGAGDLALERYGRADGGYLGSGVLDGDTPTVYFLGFDVTTPPFDEPDVRRAVSLAIDREALIEAVMDGTATPARSLVLPAVSGVEDLCEACRHDPAGAARLFAEHGVESVTLWFNDDGGHRLLAQQVRQDLQAAGVSRVAFRAPLFGEYLEVLAAGEAPLFRYGWQPEYPLADDVLFALFHSSGIPPRPEPEPEEDPEATAEPEDADAGGQDGQDGQDAGGEQPDPVATPDAGEPADPGPAEDPDAREAADAGGEDGAGPTGEPRSEGEGVPTPTAPPEGAEPLDVETAREAPEMRNYMGYADAEVDRLLDAARATTSTMRRLYYHRMVEDIVLNRDQVVVPILYYRHQRVASERVVGLAVNPMGLIDLHRVQLRRDPSETTSQD